jgi:hypothetical protein
MQTAGLGGSIPLCNTLGSLYPHAEILLIGLIEPEAQIHTVNESVARRSWHDSPTSRHFYSSATPTRRDDLFW